MKKRLLNFVFVVLVGSAFILSSVRPVQAAAPTLGISTPEEMEAFLDGVFTSQMAAAHIPGAVVSVVKDGRVVFAKGYGYSNVADQIPVSPTRSLFRVGSISKLFVWTSVMQLVEQGKLDLDADINQYLDFQIPETYPEPITLKHLLTHTPGFEEINVGLFAYQTEQMGTLSDYLKTHIPARIFPPGKVPAYSNYGAALAGYIVERVSGMPFDEYVEKNIFEPLSMQRSTFRQPVPANLGAEVAAGYMYSDAEYKVGEFEWVRAYPAGSVSATAEDMAKFMIAILQSGSYNDNQILSETTVLKMQSSLSTLEPSTENGMGYGFFRAELNGQTVVSHGGDTTFFHSGLYLLPEQNTGIFFSTNSPGGGEVRDLIFRAFMDHYFPDPGKNAPVPTIDMGERAAQYTGEYIASRSNQSGFEKVNNLANVYQVRVDEEGYVLISSDVVRRYVEIAPGVLQNVENPSKKFTLYEDEKGQIYLYNSGPVTLIKSPGLQKQVFHLGVLGFSLLLLIGTLIGWTISFFSGLSHRAPRPFFHHLAHSAGNIFVLLLLVFLVAFMSVLSDSSLVSGVPMFFLDAENSMAQVQLLPYAMLASATLMIVAMIFAWLKRMWTVWGRLHYTLLTICAWVMVVELIYWNVFQLWW